MIAQRRARPDRRPDLRPARGPDRRRPARRRRDLRLPVPHGRRRQRDHHQAARQRLVLGVAQPRPATGWPRRHRLDPRMDRRDAALRHVEPVAGPGRDHRCRPPRRRHPGGRPRRAPRRLRQSRPARVRGRRRVPDRPLRGRRRRQPGVARELRVRPALLPRRVPGAGSRHGSRSRSWSNVSPTTTSTPTACGASIP